MLSEKRGLWLGLRESVSMALASGLFGVVFGALAHTKAFNLMLAVFMSGAMYAGAAQVISLQLWAHGDPPLVELMSTVSIVCLRYLLMGFSLRPYLEKVPPFKRYLALFFLMDENWALALMKARRVKCSKSFIVSYFLAAGVLSYLCWIGGTTIGFLFMKQLPSMSAISFAFPALFLALLVGSWKGKRDLLPWGITFLVALGTKLLLQGNEYIILGALAGSVAGVFSDARR